MTPIYLEPDQQAAIEILKAANGPVESAELELSLCLDREEVFSMVTDLMASGVPVYFENEVESGLGALEGPLTYRNASTPEELYDLRAAVRKEAELMSDLQSGIENAQASFYPEPELPDAPTLHTLYALGLKDSGTILLHFTRGGEKRTCTYRGFPGINVENGSSSEIELLDQCFDSWELSELAHQLAWFEPFELQPSIVLPIRSTSDARVHLNQPGGGESIEIDLPAECGGPFVTHGRQVESLPATSELDSLRRVLWKGLGDVSRVDSHEKTDAVGGGLSS